MRRLAIKKTITAIVLSVAMFAVTSCGQSSAGQLPGEDAVNRSVTDKSEYTYIDDQAIAKAGEASPNPEMTQAVQDALGIVNQTRAANGLGDLSWSTGLEQCSAVRAQECTQAFSHTRPDGTAWYTVNSDLMYGENLAYNYNTAQKVVDAWMASPGHRANIMNGSYTTIGMAVYPAENGKWYWAQEFGY